MNQLADDIRLALARSRDLSRAEQQRAYMKSALPFYGVGVPQTRRLARSAASAHWFESRQAWLATVDHLWDEATHQEERYAALAVLSHPRARGWRDRRLWPTLEQLITTAAWWDLVDGVSPITGELLAADASLAEDIRGWARSDDMWLRRSSIIAQLGAKAGTDTDLLTDVIEVNAADTEFFIAKAIGWALRQYARIEPEWVREFLGTHELRPLSAREAAKNIS
ncbi:MAG: DNA alkylation repair protein [Arachnia sp.]